MQQRGEWPGLLGLFDLDFRKIGTFRKRTIRAEISDFWHFLRNLRLSHLYIDDFKPQNHHFSSKIWISSTNVPMCKILAPAAPKFWEFSQFFPPKSYTLLRAVTTTSCTPDSITRWTLSIVIGLSSTKKIWLWKLPKIPIFHAKDAEIF